MLEDLPVHLLYSRYLKSPDENRIAEQLWGEIPGNMSVAAELMRRKQKNGQPTSTITEDLKKALKNRMKGLGILTEKTITNIDMLNMGAAETGQQPNLFGGPSLILNKIVYTTKLSILGECVPIYFIGDYDGVQNELINGRVPSTSGRGIIFTYPVPKGYESAPIRTLPNPSESWLYKTLEKLEGNTRSLLKGIDSSKQEKILQNLEHISTIIRSAYFSTENVSDWSSRIIGTITNIEANLGVIFFPPSDPLIRSLFQSGYEDLLGEPNRSKFISASNQAVDKIEAAGYRAQIGKRNQKYVPFYYECTNDVCHQSRVELQYNKIEGSSDAILKGKCPICETNYEFSIQINNPDISDIIKNISPRVDSRQFVVSSIVNILAHVGGPGETSYYAEVMPGVRATGMPFPIYTRYSRVFYNTTWNESYANILKSRGTPTLSQEKIFTSLAKWVEAKKKQDFAVIVEAHTEIEACIDDTFSKLELKDAELLLEIEIIKKQLSDSKNRQILLNDMKKKQIEEGEIDVYLSSAFGRYAPEKYGQETSWLWIDMALISGVFDIMKSYDRLYGPWTPNSSVFFINFS